MTNLEYLRELSAQVNPGRKTHYLGGMAINLEDGMAYTRGIHPSEHHEFKCEDVYLQSAIQELEEALIDNEARAQAKAALRARGVIR